MATLDGPLRADDIEADTSPTEPATDRTTAAVASPPSSDKQESRARRFDRFDYRAKDDAAPTEPAGGKTTPAVAAAPSSEQQESRASRFDRFDYRARSTTADVPVEQSPSDEQADEMIASAPPASGPLTGDAVLAADHLSSKQWSREDVLKILQGPDQTSVHDVAGKKASVVSQAASTPAESVPTATANAAPAASAPDADTIVLKLKSQLRAATLKQIPAFLQALVADRQPTPEEQKRYDDYKKQADWIRLAEGINTALAAIVTVVNPLAGAIAGVGLAAANGSIEMMAKEVDDYVPPWLKKNAGIDGTFAMLYLQKMVYSWRGFTSIGFDGKIYGLRQPDDAFENNVDLLLAKVGAKIGVSNLNRYFPINQVTETLPLEDRDNEKVSPYDWAKRVVPQYLPDELERILTEGIEL